MKNFLLQFVCFVLLGLFYPSEVFAFLDEFDSQASLDNYIVSTNSGSVVVESGKLILSAPSNTKHFPYVELKNNLIGEQVENISIDFRYSYIGVFGAGIIIDDNYPVNGSNYDVGSNSIVWTWNWGAPPILRLGKYPFIHTEILEQTGFHNLKIIGSPGMYEIYLDDIFHGTTNSSKTIDSVWFGNPDIVSTTSSWPVIEIDRIEINNHITDPSFPYFSQRDSKWKDVVYDSATGWAGTNKNTIERWGCAITSVAMVLKKYGVNMPDGEEANPDNLNTWLLSQPDGYVGNGLLNWLAITRLARLSRVANHSPTDLEFKKSINTASEDLTNGYYPIINEGGHFVAMYDQHEDMYRLNDPYDASRSSKAKSEAVFSTNTFIPSNTNLAYLMFILSPNMSINLGNYYEEYINDDIDHTEGMSSRIVYVPKPSDGQLTLDVNNTGSTAMLQVYSYDTNGNVDMLTNQVPNGLSQWWFIYHQNGEDPSFSPRDTAAPVFVGSTLFSGWYNKPQVVTFNFEDQNMPSEYIPPTCTISGEGNDRTCTVTVNVCDNYYNCTKTTLVSNPANIDSKPPLPPKHIWGIGLRPYSFVYWDVGKDAVKYFVEWGTDRNRISQNMTTDNRWIWIPSNIAKTIYVRVSAIDRAGNVSKPSKIEKIDIKHHHYWRW